MKTHAQLQKEGRSQEYIAGYRAYSEFHLDAAEKGGPTRAGYTWVKDPAKKGGGYWRKLKGGKAQLGNSAAKPKDKFWKGVGAGVAGTIGTSVALNVGGALAANAVMKNQYKQAMNDPDHYLHNDPDHPFHSMYGKKK